jgi:hypothetical protein
MGALTASNIHTSHSAKELRILILQLHTRYSCGWLKNAAKSCHRLVCLWGTVHEVDLFTTVVGAALAVLDMSLPSNLSCN